MNEEREGIAKSQGFPCGSCGGRMVFSPELCALSCPHCGGTEPIEAPEVEAPEYPYDPESKTAAVPDWGEGDELLHTCSACGAETVTVAAAMTVTCPFCGSHYVTEPRAACELLRPETMLPHRLSQGEANALYHKWARRRTLAPRAFRRAAAEPEMQGVYLPYFTFDTDLSTAFSGEGGRRRTVSYTVRVNGKTVRRTRTVTDWYPVRGERGRYEDDTPLCASRTVDARLLSRIGPFGTKRLRVYSPAYLAGFVAERYTVGLGEGFERIRPGVERRMESEICASLGYDTYRGMRYRHTYRRVTFKHILLPVWLSSYTFRGKVYPFMVNGESGRVAGRAPLSPLKLFLLILGGVAAVCLLFLLIVFLGEGASPN